MLELFVNVLLRTVNGIASITGSALLIQAEQSAANEMEWLGGRLATNTCLAESVRIGWL